MDKLLEGRVHRSLPLPSIVLLARERIIPDSSLSPKKGHKVDSPLLHNSMTTNGLRLRSPL